MYFSYQSHYISSGTVLLFPMSPFQHHLIRCPKLFCWFSDCYVLTSWELLFFLTSRSFLEITLTDSKHLYYLEIEIVRFNPQRNRNILVPNICALSKHNLSQIIHQWFCHVYISRLKPMSRKDSWRFSQKIYLACESSALFFFWPRQLKFT